MAKLPKAQVEDIVRRYTPSDWIVRETRARTKSKSGQCDFLNETISVPKLEDAQSIYVFLHECQHYHLGHYRIGRVGHVQEYEAERSAIALARIEGIQIPRHVVKEARAYVRLHIARDEREGFYIEPRVRKWAQAAT